MLSVIIPAYNEGKRIEKTLMSVYGHLSRQDFDYEVLVVDDGSTDDTVRKIKSHLPAQAGISNLKNLKLIENKENHGKGWVVRQGMKEATGDIRLFMDADNSTSIDQLAGFMPYFSSEGGSAFGGQQGYDIVIGSRRMKDSVIAVHQPWMRDFLGGIFRFIVHMLVPLGVTDSQAGFKAFSARAVPIIFPKQTIFRWAFDVELLAIARRAKLKIKEVPIVWINDIESHVKLGGMVRMLFEVLQVRLNLWRGKYD